MCVLLLVLQDSGWEPPTDALAAAAVVILQARVRAFLGMRRFAEFVLARSALVYLAQAELELVSRIGTVAGLVRACVCARCRTRARCHPARLLLQVCFVLGETPSQENARHVFGAEDFVDRLLDRSPSHLTVCVCVCLFICVCVWGYLVCAAVVHLMELLYGLFCRRPLCLPSRSSRLVA